MASLMPNLYYSSPTPITTILQSKDKPPTTTIQQTTSLSSPRLATSLFALLPKLEPPPPSSSSSSSSSSYPLRVVQVDQPPATTNPTTPKPQPQPQEEQRNDFYVNLGLAVRTLREDLPFLFSRDLNYHIYRDDITFVDPLNTFAGIENYKLIFWALRFHGRILFREIGLEVLRIWQPSENVILIRWNLRGIPRVPWEAKGQFQGTSRYKLDRNGKIYEHKVDNLAFNFPRPLKPAASVLDLVGACPASPNPTFLWGPVDDDDVSSSWVEFYRAVRETLDCQNHLTLHDRLVTCSWYSIAYSSNSEFQQPTYLPTYLTTTSIIYLLQIISVLIYGMCCIT